MNPDLSRIFNHFFGINYDFIKFNKPSFEKKLKPVIDTILILPKSPVLQSILANLDNSRASSPYSFCYPIQGSNEIYVRLSSLEALRNYCVELLDTLPDAPEKALREFLIYSEKTLPSSDILTSGDFTFVAQPLKPL